MWSMAVSRTSPPRRQGRFSATESGKAAKRWHMTLLWQRGAACRWHPCCPYGAPSLHNLSDWLSASFGAAKAGSGSPLQQPGHPFRWQQCYRFSDIADATAYTCPDVCERRPGGALWFLWEPLAEEGRKALQRRAGGTRFWREEGRSISFGNVGEWPFPLMRGGYLLLRPNPAIRIPSMGAAIRTSAKLKSVSYVPAAAAGRGNIGTSRDGRHVRHRFGGQPCSIGHCGH